MTKWSLKISPTCSRSCTFGANAAVVYDSRIMERAGKQEEMASLNSDASDVLSKTGRRFSTMRWKQPRSTTLKAGSNSRSSRQRSATLWVGVSRRETAAVLNGCGAVVEPENLETFGSQPSANLTTSAPHVDDALIFRESAGVDRFKEFLLGLVGFPVGSKFGILPLVLPSMQTSRWVQLGNSCSSSED